MDWVPIVFGGFKLIVLLVAMFFAIKWHYDKDKEKKQADEREAAANHTNANQANSSDTAATEV